MRYIITFTATEEISLRECMNNHPLFRCRKKAHVNLLSLKRFKVNQIASIFKVDRDTIASWLTLWERLGITGVYDAMAFG
ncbi:MAG: hypothetical protein ACK4M7_10300 [Burkholderiales bacterium]